MIRVHIVGCPRSGTTLLMELMSTCFHSGGFCAHELSIFAPLQSPAEPYFSKQPNDIRQLRLIFGQDPGLHVIYIGRDPRAVVTSKHRDNPEQYFCNYRVWSECDRAAERYRGHPRFLELRYEDLVTDPDSEQGRIEAQFPFLERRYSFSDYHLHATPSEAAGRAMNGLRAVNPDSLNKWRQHLPRVSEQHRRHPQLAADLVRLGYESDWSWLAMLEDVEPLLFPCRYPERRPWLKELEKEVRVWFRSRRYLRRL